MALCKLFLVVLVATAAFWTAAEAYEGQSTRSWGPRRTPSKTPKCKPPYSGHWRMVVVIFRKSSFSAPWRLSTHFPYRNPVYHFYMSALTKTVYTGAGTSVPETWRPTIPPRPLTLMAQFNKTTCVFAGTITMPTTNRIYSFVWSVIDRGNMTGPVIATVNGRLAKDFTLEQKAVYLGE